MKKLITLLALVALSACTPEPTAPPDTITPPNNTVSTTASAEPTETAAPTRDNTPLGEPYELTDENTVERNMIATAVGKKHQAKYDKNSEVTVSSREGVEMGISGVYRLADDRVMVEAWITPPEEKLILLGNLHEPGIRGVASEMFTGEFSDVVLTKPGNDTQYLPVRAENEEKSCLCTTGFVSRKGSFPVFVVMTAPKEATEVNLDIPGYDTFKNIPVQPEPPQRNLAPMAFGYQYRLLQTENPTPDTIRITYTIEKPKVAWSDESSRPPSLLDGRINNNERIQRLLTMTPDGTHSGHPELDEESLCPSCTNIDSLLPKEGYGIKLQAELSNPGSENISPFSYAGWMTTPLPNQVTTTPTDGTVLEYKARWKEEGIRSQGTELNLDTAVLFNFNKDTLTKKASKIINKAVTTLQTQEGRTLKITGHTDTTGTDSYNLDLSKRRANTVKNALAKQLGTGWTLTAEGKGETNPAISEKGLTGNDLKQAQATNRRVQITIQ